MINLDSLQIAIVYDWIDKWGGVERLLLILHELFPQADFYTSYADLEKAQWAKDLTVYNSFLQSLPGFIKKNRLFSLLFYPYAFESFNLKKYDLILSVTSSFGKSVITRPETLHISYILTPTRFLWSYPELYGKRGFTDIFTAPIRAGLRKWDFIAAQRPDHILTLSQHIKQRIHCYYRRDAEVIHPPFDLEYWKETKRKALDYYHNLFHQYQIPDEYYLIVSRLEPYKRVDLAIKTFNKRTDTLVVVGIGTEAKHLKKMAGKNIRFVDSITDEQLVVLYKQAKALIMPQDEDFGYVALEAQFFGCPIIYYKNSAVAETVLEGKTAISFEKQTVADLQSALERFHIVSYNMKQAAHELGEAHVSHFSKEYFKEKIVSFIKHKLE